MGSTTENGGTAETGHASDLSYDDCFDLLSNHRRRYTLHYIQQNGEEATIGELSDQIAAWENETEVDEVSYDQRKRVYTSLQQVHLPRMEETDIINFDDREGTIEVGETAENLDIYLEIVQGRDIPWSQYYFGLTLINIVFLGAAGMGIGPFAAISAFTWALFILTTFLVSSLSHLYITRTQMQLGSNEEPPELQQ
jgi:hypothetical protein